MPKRRGCVTCDDEDEERNRRRNAVYALSVCDRTARVNDRPCGGRVGATPFPSEEHRAATDDGRASAEDADVAP